MQVLEEFFSKHDPEINRLSLNCSLHGSEDCPSDCPRAMLLPWHKFLRGEQIRRSKRRKK